MAKNDLLKIFGFFPTLLSGDAAVLDRWLWLRKNLHSGDMRTLDAGCGSGAFSLYAAKRGNEVLGISFNDANNRKAAARAAILNLDKAKFRTGDLRQLHIMAEELGRFDQIICFETIEHILDDRKLLRDLSSLLRTGGRLLLTAPYKNYHPMPGEAISVTEDGGHVRWGYDHKEMEEKMSAAGLTAVKREYVTGVVNQGVIRLERLLLLCGMNSRLAWALTFPLRALRFLDAPLTKFFNYPHLSIAVVAEKT